MAAGESSTQPSGLHLPSGEERQAEGGAQSQETHAAQEGKGSLSLNREEVSSESSGGSSGHLERKRRAETEATDGGARFAAGRRAGVEEGGERR